MPGRHSPLCSHVDEMPADRGQDVPVALLLRGVGVVVQRAIEFERLEELPHRAQLDLVDGCALYVP